MPLWLPDPTYDYLQPRRVAPWGTLSAVTVAAESADGTGTADNAVAAVTVAAGGVDGTGAADDAAVTVTDAPRPVSRMFAIPRAANF